MLRLRPGAIFEFRSQYQAIQKQRKELIEGLLGPLSRFWKEFFRNDGQSIIRILLEWSGTVGFHVWGKEAKPEELKAAWAGVINVEWTYNDDKTAYRIDLTEIAPSPVTLLAIAPEDGWAYYRQGGIVYFVRPPWDLGMKEVPGNEVGSSIAQGGYWAINKEFKGRDELMVYLNRKMVESRETGIFVP